MKPTVVVSIGTWIVWPISAWMIHWLWNSWAAPGFEWPVLPWPQAFIAASLTSRGWGSVSLGKIADVLHDYKKE